MILNNFRCSGIKLDDGVFKVGDLHKNSYYLDFSEDIYSRMDSKSLRRSLSYGDLLSRRDLYKNNRRFVYIINSNIYLCFIKFEFSCLGIV